MAKFNEGDEVRLKKVIMGIQVRPNTIGEIKKIKGGFGSKEYHIRWRGLNYDVIMKGDKNFIALTGGEG